MQRWRGSRAARGDGSGCCFFVVFGTSILLIGTGGYQILVPQGTKTAWRRPIAMVSSKSNFATEHHTATEAGFHRCWYPVALGGELASGSVIGRDFLGTRVVVYRDAAGNPVVQSAWCPHLGADLSVGQIADGRLRCPYHHWSFDTDGTCANIPAGDKIPPSARI